MAFLGFDDEYFMNEALKQARQAYDEGEVPVGAVVVSREQIIAKAYNMTEKLADVTAHAEMLVITSAVEFLGGKYLSDCTLYVTLEPCVMCAGALQWAQVGGLIFGTADEKRGFSTYSKKILHPKTKLASGIKEEECKELIVEFFKSKR